MLATAPLVDQVSRTHLWKINTESIHVHAIQEAGKALRKASKTLVHELQLHKVLFQVGHGVAQLCEAVLQALERIGRRCAAAALGAVAEGAARGGAERGCWARARGARAEAARFLDGCCRCHCVVQSGGRVESVNDKARLLESLVDASVVLQGLSWLFTMSRRVVNFRARGFTDPAWRWLEGQR